MEVDLRNFGFRKVDFGLNPKSEIENPQSEILNLYLFRNNYYIAGLNFPEIVIFVDIMPHDI
jgi:hypothetical protein